MPVPEIGPTCAESRLRRYLGRALLLVAAAFFALHFVHLAADFPNGSPWMDWSKYTDEGWYGDAAIRHFLLGHWYLQGDFNPGVVMPVWPLLEAAVFQFTGVSLSAARALTVAVFGVLLLGVYLLIERSEAEAFRGDGTPEPSLAAPLAVLFLCTSPFLFAFDRLAILEPLLATLTVLAMLTASRLATDRRPGSKTSGALLTPGLLGVLLAAMVLTKPTAIALMPAVVYMVWARAGKKLASAWRLALSPVLIASALWLAYYILLVRPHFREDYEYLFAANAYTGFQLEPLARVLFNTIADGRWMGAVLYPLCFAVLFLLAFVQPWFHRRPLVAAFLLWAGGYLVFLAYHNNLQPRYYLLLAVPVTALTAMGLVELGSGKTAQLRGTAAVLRWIVLGACVLVIALPDAVQQIEFLLHPEYTYRSAAQSIARLVRDEKTRSPLILSVSGSDLSLMTGLPSIDDDFGTLDLDQRVAKYRPGWYVAWNEIDDDKMDALQALYHPVRVAAFPALDDPDRNLMILYRLDPTSSPRSRSKRKPRIPRPLRTRLGQQPATQQLQH